MIRHSKQNWAIGEIVKVGFLKLRVCDIELTPGDSLPDAYILCGLGDNTNRKYRFVPHNGLERFDEIYKP